MITWEGRLDNREDLVSHLHGEVSPVLHRPGNCGCCYQNWRNECFGKLVGDWALSIFDPQEQAVILAKDFLGTRPLYYSMENHQLAWCSILDPLLLLSGRTFALNEEYIAGWLSFFPAPHLTPYEGIHSFPPSCVVRLTKGKKRISEYWALDPSKRIRHSSDAEYEEHFRSVFAHAVRRRLRSDNPILAELSGGMDSSSIVCVADEIISRGQAGSLRLDTVSYYDDSEPNWNERPYFNQIEEKRGRHGCHIDVSSFQAWTLEGDTHRVAVSPGSLAGSERVREQFASCLASQGNRVVLSGIGGDEVTGGVPTPTPDLADLLSRCHLESWRTNSNSGHSSRDGRGSTCFRRR